MLSNLCVPVICLCELICFVAVGFLFRMCFMSIEFEAVAWVASRASLLEGFCQFLRVYLGCRPNLSKCGKIGRLNKNREWVCKSYSQCDWIKKLAKCCNLTMYCMRVATHGFDGILLMGWCVVVSVIHIIDSTQQASWYFHTFHDRRWSLTAFLLTCRCFFPVPYQRSVNSLSNVIVSNDCIGQPWLP